MIQGKTIPSLALALSVLALSFSGTQRDHGSTQSCVPWPPHPSHIVNLSSEAANSPVTLLPQQSWSAYFVPPGTTLVVTNAWFEGEELILGEFLGSALDFRRRGTKSPSTLSGSGADPGAPLGWTFSAGSQVAFRNDASTQQPLAYQLVGYLVKGQ